MNTVVATKLSTINSAHHVVDLMWREVDALRRGAEDVLTKKSAPHHSDRVRVRAAARALDRLQHTYDTVLSKPAPHARGASPALTRLHDALSATGPLVRKALQSETAFDDGTTNDNLVTGSGSSAENTDTFATYDAQTQQTATNFYDTNASGTVNDIYEQAHANLREQLMTLARQGGGAARDDAQSAANDAANNLDTAVGLAIGALVGGPVGAAIGAVAGAAVFALARRVVLRMLAAFDDLLSSLFG